MAATGMASRMAAAWTGGAERARPMPMPPATISTASAAFTCRATPRGGSDMRSSTALDDRPSRVRATRGPRCSAHRAAPIGPRTRTNLMAVSARAVSPSSHSASAAGIERRATRRVGMTPIASRAKNAWPGKVERSGRDHSKMKSRCAPREAVANG
ncbi:MAG: hypothetical protein DLM71_06760 [Chloroflexi bacterium]|nr:MAG: hypothetical protein DLM71_06760 [Chloroflexota bacterium]